METGTQDRRISRETGPARRVAELAEPVAEDLGFRLVRVRMSGKVLQVMAERADGTFSIEDCEALSRALSPLLDVTDPVKTNYALEVSSPGIDRPLVRPGDFETWAGHEAKIEMHTPIDGRKRFRGVLEGYLDGEVRLFLGPDSKDGEEVLIGLAFDDIGEAKLVMTDRLIEMVKSSNRPGSVADGSEWSDDET